MNEKLTRLGIIMPFLPLTSVGSFPKPAYVKKARTLYARGHPLRKIAEENATKYWLNMQRRLGFDVFVHGEMERGDMVAYFGEELEGFQSGDSREPVRSFGNRFWIPPEIIGDIKWKKPITLAAWEFAQLFCTKPVKGMLTGPATIYDWSLDGYYGNRHRAVLDIARMLRKEIRALIRGGVKIIQIDEPSLAQTEQYFDTLYEAFCLMLKGFSEQAYFIMHTCYGEDIFETLYPRMLTLPVDNLDLETANSGMRLLRTIGNYPITKDLSLGFLDVHERKVESVLTVVHWIQSALTVVSKERLWLGPDCGLKALSIEQAEQKMLILRAARDMITAGC